MRYNHLVMFQWTWSADKWKQVRYIGMALEFGENWHFIQNYDNGEVTPVLDYMIRVPTDEEGNYEGLKRQVGR